MLLRFHFSIKSQEHDFEIAAEFDRGLTGVFGPAQSGKTLFLKCLAGIVVPDSGQIMIGDELYFSSEKGVSKPLESSRIAIVWQDSHLFPHLTVEGNIKYGQPEKIRQSFVDSVLDIFKLRDLLNKMTTHLSAEEKHCIAIARALLTDPLFLLVDELPDGIDFVARQRIISCLKTVNQELSVPIVFVSPSVSELMFLCPQVMVIEDGRKVHFDAPERIFINEKNLSKMKEDFVNILEVPVKILRREEQMAELDMGGVVLKVAFVNPKSPKTLKIGIRSKDILISLEKLKGVSARNILLAVIEKVERTGQVVMLRCRVGDKRLWVEITPGSFRDMGLHVTQMVYLVIKTRIINVLG